MDALTYGYGVMKVDGFYSHSGQTFYFLSYVTYIHEKKSLIVLGTNDTANIPLTLVFFKFGEIKP